MDPEREYVPDGALVHGHTPSLTPWSYLASHVFFEGRRKPENPDETQTDTGRNREIVSNSEQTVT